MNEQTLLWLSSNGYDARDLNRMRMYGNSALMKAAREGNSAVSLKRALIWRLKISMAILLFGMPALAEM